MTKAQTQGGAGSRARPSRARKNARRGPQQRGERTRDRILRAAEKLFAERGFSNTSIDVIAEEVGIQQPGVFYYFPNKRALYEAVAGEALRTVEERTLRELDTPRPPRENLIAMVEMWVDLIAARPTLARLMLHEAANPDSTTMPRIFPEMGQRLQARFERIFRQLGLDAHPDSVFHFESTITGSTLFYAAALERMVSGRNESDVQHSMELHKRLLVRTTMSLLDELETRR